MKDREAWCAAVRRVTKSWTWLSDWTMNNSLFLWSSAILAADSCLSWILSLSRHCDSRLWMQEMVQKMILHFYSLTGAGRWDLCMCSWFLCMSLQVFCDFVKLASEGDFLFPKKLQNNALTNSEFHRPYKSFPLLNTSLHTRWQLKFLLVNLNPIETLTFVLCSSCLSHTLICVYSPILPFYP